MKKYGIAAWIWTEFSLVHELIGLIVFVCLIFVLKVKLLQMMWKKTTKKLVTKKS